MDILSSRFPFMISLTRPGVPKNSASWARATRAISRCAVPAAGSVSIDPYTRCCHFWRTLFEALKADQLAQLAAQMKLRSLEPGEVLFAQGGTEATLFIVVYGILKVSQHTERSGAEDRRPYRGRRIHW